jgi:hypothetical protein
MWRIPNPPDGGGAAKRPAKIRQAAKVKGHRRASLKKRLIISARSQSQTIQYGESGPVA